MKKLIATAIAMSLSISATVSAEKFTFVTKSVNSDGIQIDGVEVKPMGLGFVRLRVESSSIDSALEKLSFGGIDTAALEYDSGFSLYVDKGVEVSASGDAYTQSLSNDPEFSNQSNFKSRAVHKGSNNLLDGLNYQKENGGRVRVAVLDTGYIPHVDVNVAGGYNFSTLFGQEQGGNYIDLTSQDSTTCSSGHGLAVASIIGASQNNNIGMFGVADVDLYMGRIISTDCANSNKDVGQLSDLFDGLLWAVTDESQGGIDADIINLSIEGESVCPSYIQEVIDLAMSQGKHIVVSAGNSGDIANRFVPANCNNVIVVGANNLDGSGETYTNTGDVVDIAAMGDALVALDGDAYGTISGTSMSAAFVSGSIARLLGNFPTLNQVQTEEILKTSSTSFKDGVGDSCLTGCGTGYLDLVSSFKYTEKVFEPKISFTHLYENTRDTCDTNEAVTALMSFTDVCNTMIANFNASYFGEGVIYQYKLLKKEKHISNWGDSRTEVVKNISGYGDVSSIVIKGFDMDTYDYGVVACDGDNCPFVEVLEISQHQLPPICK
tara:strand:- start:98 stop:1747 length:1650 start_codon:yes stop_codon:yes gene_type:complete